MGEGVKDLDKVISENGLVIPIDLMPGSYRWRAYLYANLFKDRKIDSHGKIALNQLSEGMPTWVIMPWTRKHMVPLDKSQEMEMLQMLTQMTVFSTDSGDVFRAGAWQMRALEDGLFYTDDHVLSLIPQLEEYVRRTP